MTDIRLTPQRCEVIERLKLGEKIIMSHHGLTRPRFYFSGGGQAKEDVVDRMLKAGLLVPLGDGLFKGAGQTLVLSKKLEADCAD